MLRKKKKNHKDEIRTERKNKQQNNKGKKIKKSHSQKEKV